MFILLPCNTETETTDSGKTVHYISEVDSTHSPHTATIPYFRILDTNDGVAEHYGYSEFNELKEHVKINGIQGYGTWYKFGKLKSLFNGVLLVQENFLYYKGRVICSMTVDADNKLVIHFTEPDINIKANMGTQDGYSLEGWYIHDVEWVGSVFVLTVCIVVNSILMTTTFCAVMQLVFSKDKYLGLYSFDGQLALYTDNGKPFIDRSLYVKDKKLVAKIALHGLHTLKEPLI